MQCAIYCTKLSPQFHKDAKEVRDQCIFDMWMACHTGAEIVAAEHVDEKTVGNVVSGISEDLPKFQKSASEHAADLSAWSQRNVQNIAQ